MHCDVIDVDDGFDEEDDVGLTVYAYSKSAFDGV